MTITVEYHDNCSHLARTLSPEDLGHHKDSGWTIEGEVMEDYYEWVNDFVATHPDYGRVEGNFESTVTADSQESFDHFVKHHPFTEWDYWDI